MYFPSQSTSSFTENEIQKQYFAVTDPSTAHISEIDDEMDSFEEMMEADENGNNMLVFAVCQGREDLVISFADQGGFLDQQNYKGETALYWASSLGFENIVDVLLEYGANANITTVEGVSPLHIASANGHLQIVRKLVQNGAFVNGVDDENDTPTHYAVRENQFEVVRILAKECNARTDLKNEDLETPLELAQCLEESNPGEYSNIIQLLNPSSSTNTAYFMDKKVHSSPLSSPFQMQQNMNMVF